MLRIAGGIMTGVWLFIFAALVLTAPSFAAEPLRPNILWLTNEDMGPQLGCYGDTYATSPHIDGLAKKSLRYLHCWSNAPVCAPARTTLISGLYPPSTGAEHMRSLTSLPAGFQMYPQFLRELGYYCTNNVKEDYNLAKPQGVWDESSPKAHYKNRKPGQPFFAIFNFTVTHESQIRKRPHQAVHDPAQVKLPAYHPDTLEARQDWAQYYDNITTMDAQVGAKLKELEEAGLAEETIVFYYADHGSGMPRSKRIACNSGLHVPLLIHIPPKFAALAPADYQPGGTTNRLVSFVDFAPTLVSLVGAKPAEYLQGSAFLGPQAAKPREFLFGFRGRMDERIDLVRSVRDEQYVYVRNYLPHLPHGQHVDYMFQTPTTAAWKRLFDAGKLPPEQASFWQPRAAEELYDLKSDPDEVRNLAADPQQAARLARFRTALEQQILAIRDVGFLPEDEIHSRAKGSTPYEVGHTPAKYPLERILDTANLASLRAPGTAGELVTRLADPDSAVRYWAVLGLQMRGAEAVQAAREQVLPLLKDPAPAVQIAAAEALASSGAAADVEAAMEVLLAKATVENNPLMVPVEALAAISNLGPKAKPYLDRIRPLAAQDKKMPGRYGSYVDRLVAGLVEELGEQR